MVLPYSDKRPYDLVIFDWDGTLCASLDRIVQAMQMAAAAVGLDVPSNDAVRQVIGLGLQEALLVIFGQLSIRQIDALKMAYRDAYTTIDVRPSPLYSGALEVLETLKAQGLMMAIATGKNREGLDRVLQGHNLTDIFVTTCSAEETRSKPAPDMLEAILARLDVTTDRALMVGDTTFDLEMAQSIGMDRAGVSFGSHPAASLLDYEPIVMLDNLPQLLDVFKMN